MKPERAAVGVAPCPIHSLVGRRRYPGSEHRVPVRGLRGNRLQHVPVLHDLAMSIETRDVDASPVAIAWPILIAVQDDVVPFRDALA